MNEFTPSKILRAKDLKACLNISSATFWRWVKEPSFPRKIQMGPRAVGWDSQEVSQWLKGKKRT